LEIQKISKIGLVGQVIEVIEEGGGRRREELRCP